MDAELLEQIANLPYSKYLTILLVLVVLPTISTTLLNILKNKTASKLIKTIELNSTLNQARMDAMCNKIDTLYQSKFTEATIEQISIAFDNRAYIDKVSILKKVRGLIAVNHVHDHKDQTVERIHTYVANIHNKSKNKLSCFEYKGRPIGEHFNDSWIELNTTTVEEFIYENNNDNSKVTYNYDVLLLRLKSNFETINNEFHDNLSNT